MKRDTMSHLRKKFSFYSLIYLGIGTTILILSVIGLKISTNRFFSGAFTFGVLASIILYIIASVIQFRYGITIASEVKIDQDFKKAEQVPEAKKQIYRDMINELEYRNKEPLYIYEIMPTLLTGMFPVFITIVSFIVLENKPITSFLLTYMVVGSVIISLIIYLIMKVTRNHHMQYDKEIRKLHGLLLGRQKKP